MGGGVQPRPQGLPDGEIQDGGHGAGKTLRRGYGTTQDGSFLDLNKICLGSETILFTHTVFEVGINRLSIYYTAERLIQIIVDRGKWL